MILAHNMQAMNAFNHSNINRNKSINNIEKLSTGFKINRAADNSAGLLISEGMRGQIRGLDQAVKNSDDGIQLIHTADGGMSEIHSSLQRMRELCVTAASDTLTYEDRRTIQLEIDELKEDIDFIANNTEFNTIKVLCGGTDYSAPASQTTHFDISQLTNLLLPPNTNVSTTSVMVGSYQVDFDLQKDTRGYVTITAKHDGNILGVKTIGNEDVPTITWQRAYGSAGNDYANGIIAYNGGFVITGAVNQNGGDVSGYNGGAADGWTISVDANGNMITSPVASMGNNFYDHFAVIRATSDGGYITGGRWGGSTDGSWAVKSGGSGTNFNVRRGTLGGYGLSDILNTSDGGYIILEGVSLTPGTDRTRITKLDSQGRLLWNKTLNDPSNANGGTGTGSVCLAPNGNVVVLDNLNKKITMIDVVNTNNIQVWNLNPTDDYTNIIASSDGNYYISGNGKVAKVALNEVPSSATGNPVQLNELYNLSFPGNATKRIVEGNNGEIILVGTSSQNNSDGWIAKLVDNGQSLSLAWEGVFGGAGIDVANDLVYTSDGGFMVTGYTTSSMTGSRGQEDYWLARLDRSITISQYDLVDMGLHQIFDGNKILTFEETTLDFDPSSVSSTQTGLLEGIHIVATLREYDSDYKDGLILQVGANSDQKIIVELPDMRTQSIGLVPGQPDLTTNQSAGKSIEYVENAIEKVSDKRAKMGSIENRLEKAIGYLENSSENLSYAESDIRDTNYAKEMVALSKNRILTSASEAMLTQANKNPRNILELLQ